MANMKFKVGDKVRITKSGVYKGDIAVITRTDYESITNKLGYQIQKEGETKPEFLVYFDEELELAGFTKADLKNGMVVEYRNGDRRLVLNEKFIGNGAHTHFYMYTDDLMAIGDLGIRLPGFKEFDIVKVYDTDGDFITNIFDTCNLKLIWERKEEHKEMTVEEIEKKLGYKIKVVADK